MRCDVNVSVRRRGQLEFGTKVEIKNMNSFNAMQRAIEFEFVRQVQLLEDPAGETIVQETRLWDENKQCTASMRKKEGLADYRYFPEPDLPELRLSDEYIQSIKENLPELPSAKRDRYTALGLTEYDVLVLSDDDDISRYFDGVTNAGAPVKQAANWVMGDVNAICKEKGIDFADLAMKPETISEMITLIEEGVISGKIGKEILPELVQGKAEESGVRAYVETNGLVQISDEAALREIVETVLNNNSSQLEAYRNGKTKLKGFFVGQVMKESQGRANPKELNRILMGCLDGN